MNIADSHPDREPEYEQPTGLRYSLTHEIAGSSDYIVAHPTGKIRRFSYPLPSDEQLRLRAGLQDYGLILGRLLSDPHDKEQVFIIPTSSRPLAYDAGSDAEGAFTYTDDQLFFDLGEMLATTAHLDNKNNVITESLGHAVALVEFTRPDERHLLFVPGIETILEPLPNGIEPLAYYGMRLNEEFGDRFRDAITYFGMGFNETLTGMESGNES